MKKKFNVKSFVMGMVVSSILVTGLSPSLARSAKEKIDVLYNNIKVTVDGKAVNLGKDSSGKAIEPFIYNGTTYLPVRAVGEALGKEVNWDGKAKVVSIGQLSSEYKLLTETLKPYNADWKIASYSLKTSDILDIAGKEYDTGYMMRGYGSQLMFNLNSQYKVLEFDYGPSYDYSHLDGRLMHIYLDDKLYKSIPIKATDLAKSTSVPVDGVNQIRFEIDKKGYAFDYVSIGNPRIK